MKSTSILVSEHCLIEQVLNCLERMVERCEYQRKLELAPARDATIFLRGFVERYRNRLSWCRAVVDVVVGFAVPALAAIPDSPVRLEVSPGAAVNRDLGALVRKGAFRKIKSLRIELPENDGRSRGS
jgi:hypothetical protein